MTGIVLLLRFRGVHAATRLLWQWTRHPATLCSNGEPAALADSLARGIARVAEAMPLRPQCLPRALLLAAMLRRHGVDAELHIGVAGPDLTAHAWVEIDGGPVREERYVARRYCPIWSRGTMPHD